MPYAFPISFSYGLSLLIFHYNQVINSSWSYSCQNNPTIILSTYHYDLWTPYNYSVLEYIVSFYSFYYSSPSELFGRNCGSWNMYCGCQRVTFFFKKCIALSTFSHSFFQLINLKSRCLFCLYSQQNSTCFSIFDVWTENYLYHIHWSFELSKLTHTTFYAPFCS